MVKTVYIFLGFLFLGLGLIGVALPILPTTPFLLLTLFFWAKGSDRLQQWFLQTPLYKNHLQLLHQQHALTKRAKYRILMLATLMLCIGFYFTPSMIGKTVIIIILLIKYWVFLFKIKTLET